MLWEREGLTQRELSNLTNLMESSTVIMLNQMEKDGFIRKKQDSSDKRKLNIYLTPKAKKLKGVLLPYAGMINEIAARNISGKNLRIFLDVVEKMKINLLEADENMNQS